MTEENITTTDVPSRTGLTIDLPEGNKAEFEKLEVDKTTEERLSELSDPEVWEKELRENLEKAERDLEFAETFTFSRTSKYISALFPISSIFFIRPALIPATRIGVLGKIPEASLTIVL